MIEDAVLIAGPTASGKSALALDMAARTGGVIVNADSMQVYAGLRVLTARPDEDDLRVAPHMLYGHTDPAMAYSTGAWLADVARLPAQGVLDGRPAIFVGGTGLYFRALLGGLADIPPIPERVRTRWRYEMHERGPQALHRLLMREDSETALRLNPADGQRIVRALEVLEATGKPIGFWQSQRGRPLADPARVRKIVIEPDRVALGQRIEDRLRAMVEAGALDEVRALLARRLDPNLPAMKAIGVRPLAEHLAGRIELEDALGRTAAETRQYAKRQMTWFRNQLDDSWKRLGASTAIP